jgi:hypothetical protein
MIPALPACVGGCRRARVGRRYVVGPKRLGALRLTVAMISNSETDQLMREATAVITKQHHTIAALTEKVGHLETLLDRSPQIVATIGRDKGLLVKAVDALLAESDTERKEAAAHPVRDDTTERVKAATAGRLFTRHGGNVLPLFATDG